MRFPLFLFLLVPILFLCFTGSARGSEGGSGYRLPAHFIENRGQWDSAHQYFVRARSMDVALWRDRFSLIVQGERDGASVQSRIDVHFPVSDETRRIEATELSSARYSYFTGTDRARWQSGVPGARALLLRDAFPGGDLRFRTDQENFVYDLILAPDASVEAARFRVEGVISLKLAEDGALLLETEIGSIRQRPPVAWFEEEDGSTAPVGCRFKVIDSHTFGFELDGPRGGRKLVIDPTVDFLGATVVGGPNSDFTMFGDSVAVDDSGQITVCGNGGADAPTTAGVYQPMNAGGGDGFVARFSSDGSLLWMTYVGGVGFDRFHGLALFDDGRIACIGVGQEGYPTTPNAWSGWSGTFGNDGVLSVLSGDGADLVYSTFLNTNGVFSGFTSETSVVVTGDSRMVFSGLTSGDCLVPPGLAATSYQPVISGVNDGFFGEIDMALPPGDQLLYASYFGGTGNESITDVHVGPDGVLTFVGFATSDDLNLVNEFAPYSGGSEGFLARIDPSVSPAEQLLYATYLGGSQDDTAIELHVDDATGIITVGGRTRSPDMFPASPPYPCYQPELAGLQDCFLLKLDPSQVGPDQLIWHTLLGGTGDDFLNRMRVLADGSIAYCGSTDSLPGPFPDYPITPDALQEEHMGGPVGDEKDATFVIIDPNALSGPDQLRYSTYLGGPDFEIAQGLAIGAGGVIVLTGQTESGASVVPGAAVVGPLGGTDFFIARFRTGVAFIRGDFDGDGIVNGVVDAIALLNFQFIAGSPGPACFDAADFDDDGVFNGVLDGLGLLNFQFVPGSPPPPPPYPECGCDPTPDPLSCVGPVVCP